MRIVIDTILDSKTGRPAGEIVFHSEDSNLLFHPDTGKQEMLPSEYIAWLSAHPARRDQAGWHVESKHPTEDKPATRWQRLVNHTASPDGDTALKAVLSQEIKANE